MQDSFPVWLSEWICWSCVRSCFLPRPGLPLKMNYLSVPQAKQPRHHTSNDSASPQVIETPTFFDFFFFLLEASCTESWYVKSKVLGHDLAMSHPKIPNPDLRKKNIYIYIGVSTPNNVASKTLRWCPHTTMLDYAGARPPIYMEFWNDARVHWSAAYRCIAMWWNVRPCSSIDCHLMPCRGISCCSCDKL